MGLTLGRQWLLQTLQSYRWYLGGLFRVHSGALVCGVSILVRPTTLSESLTTTTIVTCQSQGVSIIT